MKASEATREIMKITGEKVSGMSDKLRVSHNVITERMKQDNISVAKLDEMLRLMDYKIVIMPRDVKEQDGWFRIE